MTPEEAFSAGSGTEPGVISVIVSGFGYTVLLLLAAWMLISLFKGYAKDTIDGGDFGWLTIKTILMVVMLGWLILH